MKRITIEVDDEVHAKLVDQAKVDERPLVKFIKRVLEKQARKGEPVNG